MSSEYFTSFVGRNVLAAKEVADPRQIVDYSDVCYGD